MSAYSALDSLSHIVEKGPAQENGKVEFSEAGSTLFSTVRLSKDKRQLNNKTI